MKNARMPLARDESLAGTNPHGARSGAGLARAGGGIDSAGLVALGDPERVGPALRGCDVAATIELTRFAVIGGALIGAMPRCGATPIGSRRVVATRRASFDGADAVAAVDARSEGAAIAVVS